METCPKGLNLTANNDYQLIAFLLAEGWNKGIRPSAILKEEMSLLSSVVSLAKTIEKREEKQW